MMQSLQQHFLQPIALLALSGIIPVIIFYLVKPKPEEEVMPSMTFFTEEKKDGKIRSAFRKLKHNKLLFLHLIFVLIAAIAAANLLIPGLETDGRTVVILDTSASMKDNMQEARAFAKKHLGKENTVITADSSPEILAESVSAREARKKIREAEGTAQATDLHSATQLASNYPGRLILASDLDHTISGQGLESAIRDLAGQRTVKTMKIDHENSHGFTGLRIEGRTVKTEITNFQPTEQNLLLQKPGENRRIKVSGRSTKSVEVELEPGRNELNLPPDEMAVDNVLNVYIPEDQEVDVLHLGKENKYLEKAVELINSTDYSRQESIEKADIYIVGSDYDLSPERAERLNSEVRNGSGIIMERRENLRGLAPAENHSGSYETTVSTPYSLTTSFDTEVYRYDILGKPLASPPEAFVARDSKMLYNVKDKDFREKINYPIFWKNAFKQVRPVETAQDLNLETGEMLETSGVQHKGKTFSETIEIKDTGFYTGEETYAVNLLHLAESSPHSSDIQDLKETSSDIGSDPSRKYLSALLALVAALELVYLGSRGETAE